MSKRKNKAANFLKAQKELSAQNALDEALRITDADCFWQQPSLSTLNLFSNVKMDILSIQGQFMTFLYKTYGTLAKIVDVPVDDAYKSGGFDLKAETIDEKELKDLRNIIEDSGDVAQLKTARKWARLFGGAALIVLDGNDLSKPLSEKNLYEKEFEFMAVDRWQLSYSKPNIDMPDGKFTVTNYGKLQDSSTTEVHPSRIHIMHGKIAPYLVNQQVQGWGISIYEQIFQDINQFFKGRNVMFELLDEAKTDVLKLSALQSALMSASGERAVRNMVDLIAKNKNYKSQITLSTDDEYEQKQMSFSGFEGILKEIRVMIASAANMPVNKLWGEGVTGFGSGEDSLENYNSQIENEVRTPDIATIKWMLKLRCYQLFGREVEDLEIDWKPLRVLSSTEEQTVNNQKMDNILKLFDRQLITPQEVMEMLKVEGIIVHETKALKGELEDMDFNKDDQTDDRNSD